jgi:CopG family transcriptional regulator / antitoxin EndoAI
MANITVNISFQDSLLAEIDAEAERESRSRSELLREAARLYVRRQRQWTDLFALGESLAARGRLTEAVVDREIQAARKRRAL